MIGAILTTLSVSLNSYLKKEFQLHQDIAVVKPYHTISSQHSGNEVYLSLIHIERETGAGISFSRKNLSPDYSQRGAPGWLLNLYILIAAVYQEKQYEESLHIISAVILFLQNKSVFPVPLTGTTLSLEPVHLSFTELSNIWSICGGQYYPSVVCRIRTLDMNTGEVKQLYRTLTQTDEQYEEK
ncbi:MAG: DUF4255 domain-containing protein [Tannerellaceae bacterium]|nr:DUF4255 domain-containing protein [Tannerellaceae bacterium]